MEKVNVIGWVDLTKIGVITQKDVNQVGQWCDKLIAKNPLCYLTVDCYVLCSSIDYFVVLGVTTFEPESAHSMS